MISIQDFEKITVIGYLAILLLIILVVISAYNEYCELIKDENEKLNPGSWVAGKYWANPEAFLPIDYKKEKQLVEKVIKRHRKEVIWFWIWIAVVLPSLIIINSTL